MNCDWNINTTTDALALCLRGGVRAPVTMPMSSIEVQKDFGHDPGGSRR